MSRPDETDRKLNRASALFRLGFQLIMAPFALAFAALMLFICYVVLKAVTGF